MSAVAEVRHRILTLLTEAHAAGEAKLPSERALAARFGVSRSTVREALRGLADQGGIVANHGSAWLLQPGYQQVVEALSLQLQLGELTHEQLLESRSVVEPPVAALAARRRSTADVAELERLYLFMAEAETDVEFLHHDIAFHEQLARSTGNNFFVLAVKPLLMALERTRQQSLLDMSRRDLVLQEHRLILDTVRARSPYEAGQAMWEHIGSFARSIGLTIPTDTVAPTPTTTAAAPGSDRE